MSNLRELLFKADDESTAAGGAAQGRSSAADAQGQPKTPGTPKVAVTDNSLSVPEPGSAGQDTLRMSLASRSLTTRNSDPDLTEEQKQARAYQRLKSRIHTRLVENLDVKALMQIDQSDLLETAIEQTLHILIAEEKLPLSADQRRTIAREVLYETLGLGPLEPLLADPDINDILVNGSHDVWVDRNGRLEATDIKFKDDSHLIHVIGRIVARVGRRVDESSPIVDARLPDGSRVNAIIPPLAIDGPSLSIRRFRPMPFTPQDLVDRGALSAEMGEFLGLAVAARLNILISGGTSAGKTTLLNCLSSFVSDRERIVTIEDTAELRLQQRHVVRLESRPANIEGQGQVTQRDLVRNALRMRPDRIIVGEVRGAEALDMLQAMNTGHEGSLTTVHANSPRDALSRIETLVLLAGIELSQRSIREQIGSAFDLVVQIKRMPDGRRRVVSIAEITGVQEGVISMQELFEFRQKGITSLETGKQVVGVHTGMNIRPYHERRFHEASIDLRADLFASAPALAQADDFGPAEIEEEGAGHEG